MKTIYIREETDGVTKEYDINLTRMFGEGKEPSLLEYINMFPPVSYNTKQPEVDLEKEIDKYCEPIQAWQIQEAPFTSIENCARHFYELGLNASKDALWKWAEDCIAEIRRSPNFNTDLATKCTMYAVFQAKLNSM